MIEYDVNRLSERGRSQMILLLGGHKNVSRQNNRFRK